MVAEVNSGSGVAAFPTDRSGTKSTELRRFFFCFFFAYTQFELRPDLPALVYAQSFGRQRFSEAAELVPPSVAEDEAAGCVRAGRAWRRQGDPVLQNRGGKTDGERQDNENYRF